MRVLSDFKLLLMASAIPLALAGCPADGPAGPAGPAGPQGDAGAAGTDGADGADGVNGADGADGSDGTPCDVTDNGDDTFTMDCEGSSVIFGATEAPAAYTDADAARGGALYDKWWEVLGVDESGLTDHPLYPSFGAQSGSDTWRCKECHGWDYIGRDGRYGGGSHYTGIAGLFPPTTSLWSAYMSISDGHGYLAAGLSEADIWDLVKFYREGMIDVDQVIASDGSFLGDPVAGADLFMDGISGVDSTGQITNSSCASCHGSDGTVPVAVGHDEFPGLVSNDNPPEFLHKVRFGDSGSNMPQAVSILGSLRDLADLGAFAQTLPAIDWSGTSVVNGAQLYDAWWEFTGTDVSAFGDHPLYPALGSKSGSDTWRCKECHGWDYIGKDGRYSSGSHYTGINGIFPAQMTMWQAYQTIGEDHGYLAAGLNEDEVWDLVAFYMDGTYDLGFILNPDGSFNGDGSVGGAGEDLYVDGISSTLFSGCDGCHGADGLTEVVPGHDEFNGLLSNENPQEFQHKARFGVPGSSMVITYDAGMSIDEVSDLAAYAQTLPCGAGPVYWPACE